MNAVRKHTMKVPGANLYYEVRGAGPVLLLICGGVYDVEDTFRAKGSGPAGEVLNAALMMSGGGRAEGGEQADGEPATKSPTILRRLPPSSTRRCRTADPRRTGV